MTTIESYFASLSLIEAGILASLIAGLAAGIGAVPVLVIRSVSQRVNDTMLGVAAGLMLGATAFSLVLPAIEAGAAQAGSERLAALSVAIGILAGGGLLWLVHRTLPHEHFVKGREGLEVSRVTGLWLFVIAITVHNFPEGLAVGVGFGGGDVGNGLALTTAIFLQNLPEGFAVALAMLALGYGSAAAISVALLTGLVETVGGFVGAGVVSLSAALLSHALAFSAGAMLFVISHEVIPETHRNGHETAATFGVLVGFAVMMVLDVAIA
ncbi:MAG: ZIP family metal transporter [Rhodospirillales bacterium]|nr:MAG: ZIP family metal transporter [Rhodospirillales bacterium]